MKSLDWRRVSPWAIAYFILHFAFRFVKDGLFNLLPILFVFVTQVQDKWYWGQIALGIAAVALLLYSFVYYINFRFSISDENEILLNKGVFKKERLTLNFLRVQNVNIAEPFYFKPLGLVNCIFDAAGSVSQEVILPGVTVQYADQMREQVLAFKEDQQTDTPPQQSTDDTKIYDDDKRLLLSNKEVAKFGLMSNMAILALAAFAPFMNVMFDFLEKAVVNRLESFYQQEVGILVDAAVLAIFSIFLLMVLIAVLLSVLMSLIRFYNYQLYFQAGKFKRIAGLLERHQLSVSLDKVQSITIKQNLVARLLKRYTVQCFQASSGGLAAAKSKQSLVMPVLDSEQINQVCQWVYPWLDVKTLNFKGVERALFIKNWFFYALLPSLVFAVTCMVGEMLTPIYAIVSLFILSGLVYLSYSRYGYHFYQHEGRFYGVFRSGMVSVQYRVFELYKAQSTCSISTYFMREGGLKSLSIQLASGTVCLPYLKAEQADEIINFVLHQTESDIRNWM